MPVTFFPILWFYSCHPIRSKWLYSYCIYVFSLCELCHVISLSCCISCAALPFLLVCVLPLHNSAHSIKVIYLPTSTACLTICWALFCLVDHSQVLYLTTWHLGAVSICCCLYLSLTFLCLVFFMVSVSFLSLIVSNIVVYVLWASIFAYWRSCLLWFWQCFYYS